MELETMLHQLENRIFEVEAMKKHIMNEVSFSTHNKRLADYLNEQFKPFLLGQLKQYSDFQVEAVFEIKQHYESHIGSLKRAYENEIDELKGQIKRQYKVIGLMKQEVQDLMLLLNQSNRRETDPTTSASCSPLSTGTSRESSQNETKTIPSRIASDLQIIQQQDTERTLVSSARSEAQKNDRRGNFIRIDQEDQHSNRAISYFQHQDMEGPSEGQCQSNLQLHLRQLPSTNIQQNQILIEESSPQTKSKQCSNQLPADKWQQGSPSNEVCRFQENCVASQSDMSHHSVNNLRNSSSSHKYASIPVSIGSKIPIQEPSSFEQIDFLNDITNSQFTPVSSSSKVSSRQHTLNLRGEEKPKDKQPRTKLFLEQFRKTFNKCLSSMEAKHKYSNKINSKHARNSLVTQNTIGSNMQVTFGKSKKISESVKCHDRVREKSDGIIGRQNHRSRTEKETEELNKFMDFFVNERDRQNRFLVGERKNQLRYEGDKKDGIRHGNGALYYTNGLCFEGEFKSGVREGYGILRFNHIEIYNGEWQKDQISGQGKIRNCAIINKKKTQNQGSQGNLLSRWISYCGSFKGSRFEGEGTLYLQGGQKFIGSFVGGSASGEGTLYKKNGEIESGIWKNSTLTLNQQH